MHQLIIVFIFTDLVMHRDCPLDCKVYVGNLGNNGNKTDLERAFGYYGPLRSVWVARNPPGFAFVEFEDPRDATDAVRELDGRQVAISADFSSRSSRVCYICGLPVSGHCAAAVCEWSIPAERREAALVALHPRGPDALESETTTGVAVPLLDEGGTHYMFFCVKC